MAGVGGVLTSKIGDDTLFKFLGNQETFELGRLLEEENSSQELSADARARVASIAKEIAIKAVTQVEQTGEKRHRELVDRITDCNNLLTQSLEKCYQSYLQMISVVMTIENKEERLNKMRMYSESYEKARIALTDMGKRNMEIFVSIKTDLALVQECAKQTMLSEVNAFVKKMADEDSSQLRMLGSQVSENVRSLLSKTSETTALAASSVPESSEESTTSQVSSSATST